MIPLVEAILGLALVLLISGVAVYYADQRCKRLVMKRLLVMLTDTMHGSACILDKEGKVILVNSVWEQLALDNGVNADAIGPGVNYLEVCTKALKSESVDSGVVLKGIGDLLAGKMASFEHEYPCHLSNEQRWYKLHATRWSLGKRMLCIIAHEDITTNRRGKDRLRMLERAVSYSPASIVITDRKADILYVNPKFTEVSGYSFDEVVGKNPRILKTGTMDDCGYAELWRTISHGKVWQGEFHNRRKDGTDFWELAHIAPVLDDSGKITHYVAIKEDITGKRTMDREYQRLSLVARKSTNAVIIADAKKRVVWANEAFVRLTGYSLDEIMGKNPGHVFQGPETDQATVDRIRNDLAMGKSVEEDILNYRKDGGVYWINLKIDPVRDESGTITSYIAIKNEITQRRQMEILHRSILESASSVIISTRLDGIIDSFNPAAERMLGYGKDEVIGKVTPLVFHDREELENKVAEVKELHGVNLAAGFPVLVNTTGMTNQSDEREWTLITKEGRSVPVLLVVTAIRDNAQRITGYLGIARDISARRAMQRAQLESARQFKRIAAMVPGAVFQFKQSIEGNYCVPYMSDGIVDIYGVTSDQIQEDAALLFDRIHSEDVAGVLKSIQLSARTLEPWKQEYRVLFPDGTLHWLLGHSTPVRKSDGSILWYGHIMEISLHKQAQEALKQSELRWKFALDGAGDGIWDYDVANQYVFYSSRWKSMLGYDDADIGNTIEAWESMLHPDDVFYAKNILSKHYDGQTAAFEFEARMRCKDGTWRWVLSRGQAIQRDAAGKVLRIIGTHSDVTHRKQNELALKESESRFRNLADQLPVHIWMTDKDDKLIYCNRTWLEYTGTTLDGQMKDGWVSVVHPDDRADSIETSSTSVKMRIKFSMEYRMRSGSGDYRWILNQGFPRIDPQGNFLGFIGACTDIHASKLAAISMKESQCQLEALNDKLAEEVTRTALLAKTAKNANAAKSLFLANMSHEIRTPLNAILGMSELLQQSITDPDEVEYLQTIRSSGALLLSLLCDLLDFSKIESGLLKLEQIPVDLQLWVRNSTRLVEDTITRKSLSLNVTVSPELPQKIIGDSTRLGQILLNLLSNAVKFTDSGTITVVLRPIQEEGSPLSLYVAVKDTGIGIPLDKRANLFESFNQLDPSTTRRFGGTGLGLAISKKLIELMRGSIGMMDNPGGGAIFYFSIPLIPVDESEVSDEHRVLSAVTNSTAFDHKLNILLAEDNFVNQRVISLLLQKLGCTCTIANNGQEAVDRIKQGVFDLVFMDLQMPVMDGITATREIRKLSPAMAGLSIIALTANATEEEQQKCLMAGMNNFLSKPVSMEQLRYMIETEARVAD